jgi:phosphoglycolate phosphatase-like HAD superfamily hydrolase
MTRALIFDLDGTLIDTVYAHVFAWQRALAEAGLPIEGWRIHRRIGMSGGLFTRAVARELGRPLSDAEVEQIQARHGELYRKLLPERRPLPGAVELLAHLRDAGVPFGIATSGRRPEIDASLEALGVGNDVVVVERGDVLPSRSRTCSSPARNAWEWRSVTSRSSATRYGICWRHVVRGCCRWAC